jgi:leucine dehydrogenase
MTADNLHAAAPPERVLTQQGKRSGQMITVSIHSTRLGPALGGCRITSYRSWQDGCNDAVRLSAAMTEKAALAGLHHGGGKTVVALDEHFVRRRSAADRADLLADIGDVVESFGGSYVTGPDIGSGPEDMTRIGERTAHVLCRPEPAGGSGDSSGPTALGVTTSIEAVCSHVWPGRDLSGLRFGVHGLGHVGAQVAAYLATRGARLVVSDVDGSRRALADSWGATWATPDEVLVADVDVLVPCAVGGILTAQLVGDIRAEVIVGAANNQLDRDSTADVLHEHGIIWCPDVVVSAGGIIGAVGRERDGLSADAAATRVRGIGQRLTRILDAAAAAGTTPLHEARRIVHSLLGGTGSPYGSTRS